jgi:hypothetical protein
MDLAKHWRQKSAYYRLEGQRHRQSGAVRFPPRPANLHEDATDWEAYTLSGRGELRSFTVLRQAGIGFEKMTPYAVGLVQLAEGPLVTAQLTDCGEADLAIGQPVEMVTRQIKDTGEDGLLVYGYKFRPVLATSES